ncbi:MAG: hypothetical protein ABI045_05515 [Flavobacteriales bacterium]
MITRVTTSNYLDLCKYIQGALTKISLEVNINVMPLSTFLKAQIDGKWLFFSHRLASQLSRCKKLSSTFSTAKFFAPAGPNVTHYKNPQLV